jgi:hypothetical protein
MNRKIELREEDGHLYLEFGYDIEDDLLLLEFDLVTEEDE